MQKELIITRDGSHTITDTNKNVTYHSVFGAVQESMHVFIDAGLRSFLQMHETDKILDGDLRIFEMGLGTGLNALLSLIETEINHHKTYYECVEAFPLEHLFIRKLNYCNLLQCQDLLDVFEKMHTCKWHETIDLTSLFSFKKYQTPLQNYTAENDFHLVYYDAFAPSAQPELWTKEIFEKIYHMLANDGILVTYCSKGDVRRNLIAAGFKVEKFPGPPGKREMIRAWKL